MAKTTKNAKKPTKKPNKLGNFLSKLSPNTPKKKFLTFALVFALAGGGYYAYSSFAATASPAVFFVEDKGDASLSDERAINSVNLFGIKSNLHNFTPETTSGWYSSIKVSNDFAKLAFIKNEPDALYVRDLVTSKITKAYSNGYYQAAFSIFGWSNDAKNVYFYGKSSNTAKWTVYKYELSTNKTTSIYPTDKHVKEFVISPDNTTAAMTIEDNVSSPRTYTLYTMNLSTKVITQILRREAPAQIDILGWQDNNNIAIDNQVTSLGGSQISVVSVPTKAVSDIPIDWDAIYSEECGGVRNFNDIQLHSSGIYTANEACNSKVSVIKMNQDGTSSLVNTYAPKVSSEKYHTPSLITNPSRGSELILKVTAASSTDPFAHDDLYSVPIGPQSKIKRPSMIYTTTNNINTYIIDY